MGECDQCGMGMCDVMSYDNNTESIHILMFCTECGNEVLGPPLLYGPYWAVEKVFEYAGKSVRGRPINEYLDSKWNEKTGESTEGGLDSVQE